MNSRQLQYALLLAQVRNFSQVADKLGITQPALSKQIISLENELGIKLFDRNHVPLTLTPAGSYFVEKVQKMLYEEEQLIKSMEQFKSGENGRLDIGITPFRSIYLMPPIVRKIKERYPGVEVVLHEASSSQLRKDIAEGKYDFAVINLPVDDSLLDYTLLETDTLVLAVPEHLLELLPAPQGDTIDFAVCQGLPFVVVGQTQEMRQLFDKLCNRAGFVPNISAEVVGITTAWAMASAGVGATLLPLQFVRGDAFRQGLALFEIRDIGYSRQPAVVTRRGQYISPYAGFAISLLTGSEN